MKIKSISEYAPKFQFIPCGRCDECRRVLKNSWSFRLGLEIQEAIKRKWQVGFITLTYDEAHIPTIPFECFNDGKQYRRIYCFDKNKVRKFVRNLRSKVYDDYGITGLIYMIGSEYGTKKTCRSHHHMLVCFPSEKITAKQMHACIRDLWIENGFVSPEEYIKKRPMEENFLVDLSHGAIRAAKYVCKYVCKDIGFDKEIEGIDFVDRSNQGIRVPKVNLFGVVETDKDGNVVYETAYKLFLRCRPFHLQSRSLGWSFFEQMDNEQKLDALTNGVKLYGEEKRRTVPVYIRNKMMFDNFYGYVGDKRFVRRYASDFMLEKAPELFEKKVNGIQQMFSRIYDKNFFLANGCTEKEFNFANDGIQCLFGDFGFNLRDISVFYCTIYGVPYNRCFDCDNPILIWLQRYVGERNILNTPKLITKEIYDKITQSLDMIMFSLSKLSTDDSELTKQVVEYKQRKKEKIYV